jgi:hypothetical protein
MLTMEGKLINVLRRDPGERNGQRYDGYCQVQLMTEEVLQDGQVKHALHTLSTDLVHEPRFNAIASGSMVRLAVRAYPRNGSVAFAMAPEPFVELVPDATRESVTAAG